MKKTLSIVLALTMLFALCVPSFAAVVPGSGVGTKTKIDQNAASVAPKNQTADGKVTVDATAQTETFEVTFPAEVGLQWDTTSSANMAYSLKYTLKVGSKLAVEVTSDGKMHAVAPSTNLDVLDLVNVDSMNVKAADFTLPEKQTFTGAQTVAATPAAVDGKMTYSIKDLKDKTLDKYAATFTYTVTYTEAPVV